MKLYHFFMTTLILAIPLCSVQNSWATPDTPASHLDEKREGIHGFWETQDKDGIVQLYPCGDQTCGRFKWLQDDDAANPSRDDRNPDPEQRNRPLCGMEFLGGFEPKDKEHQMTQLVGGWIYSPRHGTKFSSTLTLRDSNTLDLRGYMLTPILGSTQTWTRVTTPKSCHEPAHQGPQIPAT